MALVTLGRMEDRYVDVVSTRYASAPMIELFSPRTRALTWRDLWIALARAQCEMGLGVTKAQVQELESQRDHLDFERVATLERRFRHDVMAHIHAYGEVAPGARSILHLGATSCFVTDNADLILIRRALAIVGDRLLRVIHALARFARDHADLPTLGLTHLQPAQLTTVGKRTCLWLQDLVEVWRSFEALRTALPFRGVKGTTGTQASFLQLLGGDARRVEELERRVAEAMGFSRSLPVAGQTYPRLWDHRVASAGAELGIVLHKFSTDLRLLQSWGEVEEPYEAEQIGSSAMPYKRNPMRAERMSALAKLLVPMPMSLGFMASTQWFERTLDDSALRRATIPQLFLTSDAILLLARNVAEGLIVNPAIVSRRVAETLPFLAAEELLMAGVTAGGDRQRLHERLRKLSWQVAEGLRAGNPDNNLRELLERDDVFGPILARAKPWDPARFVGLAPRQTRRFLEDTVAKLPVPREDDLRELSV